MDQLAGKAIAADFRPLRAVHSFGAMAGNAGQWIW